MESRSGRIFELFLALIIGLSALLTAWCGYQASLWGGEQAKFYIEGNNFGIDSVKASNLSGQLALVDAQLFSLWLEAHATKKNDLAQYYRRSFRPEFARVFDQWFTEERNKGVDAATTPFSHSEYRSALQDKALHLENLSRETFRRGQNANDTSDRYVRTTVLLALVTVLAGNAQQSRQGRLRWLLLGITLIMTAYVFYIVVQSPIAN